jgi:hypothetical protein
VVQPKCQEKPKPPRIAPSKPQMPMNHNIDARSSDDDKESIREELSSSESDSSGSGTSSADNCVRKVLQIFSQFLLLYEFSYAINLSSDVKFHL